MTRKLLGLIAFVATGAGLMISAILNNMDSINAIFLIIVGSLFTISIVGHFNDLKS